jgi:ribosomal protein S18 acetylase RimI-like enzyme
MVGVRQIRLGVNVTNTGARALYRSIGFASYGVEPDALQVDGIFYGEERYVLRLNAVG